MSGFYLLATIAAIVCFLQGLVWLLEPRLRLSHWGLGYSQPVSFIVACRTLAIPGIVEFIKKRASIGILSAVVVELILTAAFSEKTIP